MYKTSASIRISRDTNSNLLGGVKIRILNKGRKGRYAALFYKDYINKDIRAQGYKVLLEIRVQNVLGPAWQSSVIGDSLARDHALPWHRALEIEKM